MTVAAWLGCGLFAAMMAWSGRPDAYPDGPATTLAAGLCGGFLGGAVVALTAGNHGVLSTVSVCTAAVGATAMIALVRHASRAAGDPPIPRTAAQIPAWRWLADPLLAALVAALAVSDLLGWQVREVLIGLVVVLLCYHPRAGLAMLRPSRRHTVGR